MMNSFPTGLMPLERPICSASALTPWWEIRSSIFAISWTFFSEPLKKTRIERDPVHRAKRSPRIERDPVHRAKHSPICLAGLGEVTTDDIVRFLRVRFLWDLASTASEFPDDRSAPTAE